MRGSACAVVTVVAGLASPVVASAATASDAITPPATATASHGAPAGWVGAREQLRAQGREVARLVAAGDADAIFARFTPEFAAQVPLPTLREALTGALAQAPVRERVGESALPLAPTSRLYSAEHRFGEGTVVVSVAFDRTGRIAGLALAPPTPLPPDPAAGREPATNLRLPFTGRWLVVWGGAIERQNYHVVAPDQRYASDFVVWRGGSTYRAGGTLNRHYRAWGRRVLAPANARVVAAVDGRPDNRPRVETDRTHPAGNHVVLDLGRGEFALLAHLRRGSVSVRPGQRVKRSQTLGRTGNSGNSSEPHLHLHVQDRAELFTASAIGLPAAVAATAPTGRTWPGERRCRASSCAPRAERPSAGR